MSEKQSDKKGSKKKPDGKINAIVEFSRGGQGHRSLPTLVQINKLFAPFMSERGWEIVSVYIRGTVLVRMVRAVDVADKGKLPDLAATMLEFRKYAYDHHQDFRHDEELYYTYQRFDENWTIVHLAPSTGLDESIFAAMALRGEIGELPGEIGDIKETLRKMGKALTEFD